MKKIFVALSMVLLFVTGCYFPITGRVINTETNQPIEGAVVMVEWTKLHGFGDRVTESYKVLETVSDKDGKVSIGGCYSPFVEPPHVTVYKKGYVAWNDEYIFPSWTKRKDFSWSKYGGPVFILETFKPGYSYDKHASFIRASIHSAQNFKSKQLIYEAYGWEEHLAFQERERSRK
jgi:hypothetical protein